MNKDKICSKNECQSEAHKVEKKINIGHINTAPQTLKNQCEMCKTVFQIKEI